MALIDGLVFYTRLEGNSNDLKGSNNGTDTAITYSVANGKIGQGAGFNGTTSIISFGNTGIPTGNAPRTVAVWGKTTQATNGSFFAITPATNIVGTQYDIFILSGKNYFSGYGADLSGTVTINDGAWHFLVATYDGTTLRLYTDGSPDGSAALTLNTTATIVNMGGVQNSPTLVGTVDEVAIWSRALSATEVSQLYNGGAGLTYPFSNASFLLKMI